MFEAEAKKFQNAGIQVGANHHESETNLLLEQLSPFSIPLRNEALQMSRVYSLLYCFENEVRRFITETLEENLGVDWWEKMPQTIKENAQKRQEAAIKDTWLEGYKTDIMGFLDFGLLSKIIINQWDIFQDIVPSQHWLKQKMDELENARNFIAHNRLLKPNEFSRIYMYIHDWNHVIGL